MLIRKALLGKPPFPDLRCKIGVFGGEGASGKNDLPAPSVKGRRIKNWRERVCKRPEVLRRSVRKKAKESEKKKRAGGGLGSKKSIWSRKKKIYTRGSTIVSKSKSCRGVYSSCAVG